MSFWEENKVERKDSEKTRTSGKVWAFVFKAAVLFVEHFLVVFSLSYLPVFKSLGIALRLRLVSEPFWNVRVMLSHH